MTVEERIKRIHELQDSIKEKENAIAELKAGVAILDNELDTLNDELLHEMISNGNKEIKVDDLVASYFCKSEFSYGDEKALLQYLKDHSMSSYITTKITESINKTALKKDLKTNQELKESLNNFVGDRQVEYVVVTTEENHQRMLEHIENSKGGK